MRRTTTEAPASDRKPGVMAGWAARRRAEARKRGGVLPRLLHRLGLREATGGTLAQTDSVKP